MNLTPQQITDNASAVIAHLNGKRVKMRLLDGSAGWMETDAPGWKFNLLEYRPKPEPRTRPWTSSEVPIGKIIRAKSNSNDRMMLCGVVDGLARVAYDGNCTLHTLFVNYEMEDGSPCGISD